MDEPKPGQVMNWTTLAGHTRDVRYVSMLVEPVATDKGVADRVIRVNHRPAPLFDPATGDFVPAQQYGTCVVFLADSNYGSPIGPVSRAYDEHTSLVLAERLPSQWPRANPSQIAGLPANRSIGDRTLRALGDWGNACGTIIVLVAIGMIVIAIGGAVSPQLTMAAIVGLVIVARVLRFGGSGDHIAPETFSRADEIAGEGIVAMDRTFFKHLGAVMRVWGKTEQEIAAAIHQHATRLQEPDPNRAYNYREAMLKQSTADWPPEARIRMGLELKEDWVPSAEDARNWATLSPAARSSYLRQGQLATHALSRAYASPLGQDGPPSA